MQQTINVGQVQPSVLSKVERIVKNWKAWLSVKRQQLHAKSMENEFCRVIGVPVLFMPIAKVLWLGVIGFVILCGVAGWLEGGAV
jgi:hypothetical protein